jgi:hypothetical protein
VRAALDAVRSRDRPDDAEALGCPGTAALIARVTGSPASGRWCAASRRRLLEPDPAYEAVAAFAPVAAVRDYAMPTRTVNRSLALRHHIAPPLDEILLSCAAYDGDAGIISSGEDCPSSESARDRRTSKARRSAV